jgi:glycosyltransferase involved in cell wall biosynthesis
MRIGISATWLSTEASARNSGLSRYAFHLIDQMSRLAPQHEFVVFAPQSFETPPDWQARKNLETLAVTPTSLPKRVAWEHFAPAALIKRHRLNIWFSAAQVIPLRSSVPTAVMVHDIIPLIFPQHHLARTVHYYRWSLRHAAKKSTLVLANSEHTKSDVVRMFGVDASKIVVTPLGPGSIATPDAKAFEELAVRQPYLLTLGNREWRKNLHGLLEAFADIAKDRPELTLVIAGAKRTTADDVVAKQISDLRLDDRVQLLGYVSDDALPDLFRQSQAFVFPSYYEGFGLPVLEALLYGAVVACSDRSSLPEVAGDCAFYFDPGSKSSMIKGIEAALTSQNRDQLIEKGLERANTFTWANTAALTLAALEKIK